MKGWIQAKRTELVMLAVAAVVIAIIMIVQSLQPTAAEKAAERQASAQLVAEALASEIHYKVGGDTRQASITVETPSGSSQQSDIDVPLRNKAGGDALVYMFELGDFVYISAQNSQGHGTVTCSIETEDGQVIASNSATGGYAIATCKGKAK